MLGNRITARLCACRYAVDDADGGLSTAWSRAGKPARLQIVEKAIFQGGEKSSDARKPHNG